MRVRISRVRRVPRVADPDKIRATMSETDREARGRAYAEAIILERVTRGEGRVEARCKHAGDWRLGGGGCGGCLSQDVEYAEQVRIKTAQVEGIFEGMQVQDMIVCERVFGYRNKMEFSFGRKWFVGGEEEIEGKGGEKKEPMRGMDAVGAVAGGREKKKKRKRGGRGRGGHGASMPRVVSLPVVPREVSTRVYALGMHAPGRYDRVVEIDECHVQEEAGNGILNFVRHRCADLGFLAYDAVDQSGLVRNLAIRTAHNTEGKLEIMVNIQTSPCEVPARLVPLAEELIAKFPDVVTVVQNMPSDHSEKIMDPSLQRLLAGERTFIEQKLCSLAFEISANSFFQTNPHQAERLYEEAMRAADLRPDDVVLDMFCGTGTIGLSMAAHCGRVIGYEIVAAAVADANRNARRNNVKNIRFLEGNLDRAQNIPSETICGSEVDIIVLDPPRSGIGPKLTKDIARTLARRIVYISCNPVTCARDIAYLQQVAPGRFVVESIVPVDMFPHTAHIEVVVSLAVDPNVPPPPRRFPLGHNHLKKGDRDVVKTDNSEE